MIKIRRLISAFIFVFVSLILFNINVSTNADINYENVVYDYSLLKVNIPSGYYDSLDLNDNYDDFSDSLCAIISANYTRLTYDNVSKVLHISDVDPENTKNVIGLYTGLSLSGGWNREHVWCKSHGFSERNTLVPYTDAHHLRATNAVVNSTRNNSDYGEVDHNSASSDIYGNYWTSDTYEPRDEVKGDCARMIFYLACRYKNTDPYYAEVIEGSTLDKLSENGKAYMGNLSTLLKWHYMDPVSVDEIYRNNIVYQYQGNRNPFIDHPEYLELCYDVSGINGYNVDEDINYTEVNDLINEIDNLPNSATLDKRDEILNTFAAYCALNNNEKIYLSQSKYDKLMGLVEDVRELYNTSLNTSDKKTIYFNDMMDPNDKSSSYRTDLSARVNGVDIYVSHAHHNYACYARQISLGYNSQNSLDRNIFPFTATNYGDYLTLSYQENVKEIDFYTPALYRSAAYFNSYYIVYRENILSPYQVLKSSNQFETHLKVRLDLPISGEIALVICGTTPAISLSSLTLTYKHEDVLADIMNTDTKASMSYSNTIENKNASMTLPTETIKLDPNGNNAAIMGYDESELNVAFLKSNKSGSNITTSELRLYQGDILVISCTGYIKNFTFTKASQNNPLNNCSYSIDGENYTSLTSLSNNIDSNVLYIKADVQIRFSDLSISYSLYDFSKIVVRFGALIDYDLYQELLASYDVTGYGVLLSLNNNCASIKTAYDSIKNDINGNNIDSLLDSINVNYSARRISNLENDLIMYRTDDGINIKDDGSNIIFSAYLPINLNKKDVIINACAFIIVDGSYILLNEKSMSLSTLADLYIDAGQTEDIEKTLNLMK